MKYRKKPVVIEAFQMTKERRNDNSEWPSWLGEAWQAEPGEGSLWIDADDPDRQRLVIGTLEGVHRVAWNDWLIRGVKGELYACRPDIFALTYEAVVTPDESFEKWLLEYYIQHGHYFSKDELHECWIAAMRATALRCVDICDETSGDFEVQRARNAITKEFNL